jgi:hypothetical protein
VICRDGKAWNTNYLQKRHEESSSHKSLLEHFCIQQAASDTAQAADVPTEKYFSNNALHHLMASMASVAGKDVCPYPKAVYQNQHSLLGVGINWNLMEAKNEGDFAMSADEQAVAFIT